MTQAVRYERRGSVGIALRAGDIDVIYVNGYGFPAWRGGPMKYAELVGLERVLADIRTFQARYGERWAPAPLLERLVAGKQGFAQFEAQAAQGKAAGDNPGTGRENGVSSSRQSPASARVGP